jgi:hypothetical protein
MKPVERLLPRLSASELAHVQARLADLEAKRATCGEALREEGWSSASTWQQLLMANDRGTPKQRLDSLRSMVVHGPNSMPLGLIAVLRVVLADRPESVRDELRYYHAWSVAADRPYIGTPSARRPVLSGIVFSATHTEDTMQRVVRRDAAMRASRAVFRTEVALLRYRLARGGFPAALNDLAPEYMAAVPDDPCGGRPLKYRLTEGGRAFLLYSIGPDLRDDGGKPQPKGPSGEEPGDIVAGKLWPTSFSPRPVTGAPEP